MNEDINRQLISELWERMGRFDFTGAGELLHDDYVCEWPQSQERIRGRENFVALNAHYPGRWQTEVRRVVADGDQAASEVELTDNEQTVIAVSFYEIRDGKICREVDYWPKPYPAPEWRAQWVEHL
jgi:ketosteroid isomerase-like protein